MHYHQSNIQNIQPITIIVSLTVALIITWFADWLRRRPLKSNIKIVKSIENKQNNLIIGRLVAKNISNNKAISVETYVETICDNGKPRDNFLPVPLFWTHSQLYDSKILRNISGNQYFYLDVFNYDSINKTLELNTPIKGHGIDDYYRLYLGSTKLNLKIYQESGQIISVEVVIEWKEEGLPSMKIQ